MTLVQMEKRMKALETTVRRLTQRTPLIQRGWYRTHAGRFASDPIFDEIAKLGRTYRKSQTPDRESKKS